MQECTSRERRQFSRDRRIHFVQPWQTFRAAQQHVHLRQIHGRCNPLRFAPRIERPPIPPELYRRHAGQRRGRGFCSRKAGNHHAFTGKGLLGPDAPAPADAQRIFVQFIHRAGQRDIRLARCELVHRLPQRAFKRNFSGGRRGIQSARSLVNRDLAGDGVVNRAGKPRGHRLAFVLGDQVLDEHRAFFKTAKAGAERNRHPLRRIRRVTAARGEQRHLRHAIQAATLVGTERRRIRQRTAFAHGDFSRRQRRGNFAHARGAGADDAKSGDRHRAGLRRTGQRPGLWRGKNQHGVVAAEAERVAHHMGQRRGLQFSDR